MLLDIRYLFSQEQLAPTVGHDLIPYQAIRTLLRMVSTCNRAGIVKDTKASPTMPATSVLNLAAILEGQAKMQLELADLKNRGVNKMEALRQVLTTTQPHSPSSSDILYHLIPCHHTNPDAAILSLTPLPPPS